MSAPTRFHIMIDAQPQEHLLSVLGRFSVLSGYGSFRKSTKRISSDITRLCPAAFNRQVYSDLINSLPKRHGNQAIVHHTAFNYYQPFYPIGISHAADLPSANKPVLPIGHDTLKHTREWRWCSDCVESDMENTGFPYFRIEHQLPGIILCPHHHKNLKSRCEQCGNNWQSICKLLVPPMNNKCPKCASSLSSIEQELDDDPLWLHETS